jgi:hypothetical protein
MAIIRIVATLCDLVNELEHHGVPAAQLERLDALIDALMALALPTLAANDVEDDLCPTCGAPLVPADETPIIPIGKNVPADETPPAHEGD